jgi:hypothetical protein
MLRKCLLFLMTVFFVTVAFADEWAGTLVDANCTHTNGGAEACAAGLNTTSFGLLVAGKAYLFNKRGSQKAAAAMKERAALVAADPHYPHSTPVTATVFGSRAGHELIVERILIE